MKTLIVSKKESEELLTYERCIPKMRDALKSISEQKSVVLERFFIPNENNTRLAIMPAACNNTEVMGGKVIVFGNKESAQGIVPLFCTKTGRLLAITDAKVMTKVRTASTSAAATQILSRKDSRVLAILGAGNQGRAHAIAISKVREIKDIYIWSYKNETIDSCIEYLKLKLPNTNIIKCIDAKDAVLNADIICTCTAGSDTPILRGEWLKDGVHINAIGACAKTRLEVDVEVLKKCSVFTDWTKASLSSSGDLAIPIGNNEITSDVIKGEVGEVIIGKIEGRISDKENTLFQSVGISIQDVISAHIIYKAAKEENKGVYVEI